MEEWGGNPTEIRTVSVPQTKVEKRKMTVVGWLSGNVEGDRGEVQMSSGRAGEVGA